MFVSNKAIRSSPTNQLIVSLVPNFLAVSHVRVTATGHCTPMIQCLVIELVDSSKLQNTTKQLFKQHNSHNCIFLANV